MKLFNTITSTLIFVLFAATTANAQVLFENNVTSISKNQDTQEVTARFNLLYGVPDYEFKKMLNDIGVENETFSSFTEITVIFEKCAGSLSPLIMVCDNNARKMVLVDSRGQNFEMTIHGKAFSQLVVDNASRLCGAEIKSGPVFNLEYSGDSIVVNGVSTRDDSSSPEENVTRRQITKEFLSALTTHIGWISRQRICYQ